MKKENTIISFSEKGQKGQGGIRKARKIVGTTYDCESDYMCVTLYENEPSFQLKDRVSLNLKNHTVRLCYERESYLTKKPKPK